MARRMSCSFVPVFGSYFEINGAFSRSTGEGFSCTTYSRRIPAASRSRMMRWQLRSIVNGYCRVRKASKSNWSTSRLMYYLRLLISVVVLFPLFGQPVVGQSQRQVEYWMSVIENGNGIERLQAVTALGSFGPEAEPAIPLLVAELADPLKSIRVAAGRSLLQVGPSAIPVLVKVLSYEGERADMLRQGAHDVLVGFGAK